MIDEKELKIGNYVKYPSIGVRRIKYGRDIDQVHKDAVRPIKLNDDILSKCMFANSGKDSTGQYFRHLRTGVQIAYVSDAYKFKYCDKIGDFVIRDEIYVEVEYLHQLQNLYYSLTGEDLVILL